MMRGEMVRYMAEKQIKHFKELQAFERLGYRFSPQRSDETTYVFLKHNQTDDIWTIGICSPEYQRYRAECNSFQREPSSWTGETSVPNHPKTTLKGQKDIEGEKRKKEKRERKATRKGLFLLQTQGKPLPELSDGPSKSAWKFRFGGRKKDNPVCMGDD